MTSNQKLMTAALAALAFGAGYAVRAYVSRRASVAAAAPPSQGASS